MEFDIETLKPTYRLNIGQFGMSNAIKIARRLKLPKELLNRAHKYLRRRKGRGPELSRLQQLREEAEKARSDALAATHIAHQQKEEYEQRLAQLERETAQMAAMKEWRNKLQPNETVWTQKFGKMAKVIRIDHRKAMVVVSVGLGQWEVPFEDVLPQEPMRSDQ